MTTYTAIPNGDVDQDSPITQPLMQLIRDNPIGMAEGATGAPVLSSGWHPYDMVNVGDGNDGKFYDFAVDGAVASVVTPDFEDGYEYRIRVDGVSGTTAANFTIELYKETSAAYEAATTLIAIVAAGNNVSGEIEILRPRHGKVSVPVKYWMGRTETSGVFAATVGGYFSVENSVEKRLRARLKWSTGNNDLGAMYMDKRKVNI